jgi:putative ABC transport system permease protein
MSLPLSVRTASRVYRMALRACSRSTPESRRADMVQTFTDACLAAWQRGGDPRVFGRSMGELWDLARLTMRFGVGRATRASMPRAAARRWPQVGAWALTTDVRHACRSLLAARADATLTVALLALGVATSSSIFGVADALVLHPVPFPHPDRLVQVWSAVPGQKATTPVIPADLAPRWLARTDLFASGGISQPTSALVTDHGDPALIQAALVSPGLFETLGVRPVLGRSFTAGEGRPGADHVVILSDELWTERFGRARDAVGHTLKVNGADSTVIGVMGPDFRFPYERQRLWMPLAIDGHASGFAFLTVRLRDGVSRQVAQAQVEAAGPGMAAQARRPWRYRGATLATLGFQLIGDETRRSVWLLFGSTALLLVMVCLNVTNLGLARLVERRRDVAIRSALGASRLRLLRHAFIEQLVVGLVALAVALPLTWSGLRLAHALVPRGFMFGSLHLIGLDTRLLAVMIGLTMAAPLLAGLTPALAGSKRSVLTDLRLESRSTIGTGRSWLFRQSFVVVEVACAVVLLVSAALLARSFVRLQQVDLGFDSRNLLWVALDFPSAPFPTDLSRDLYIDRATARIAHLPGVTAVTPATGVPPEAGLISLGSVVAEGQPARTNVLVSGYNVDPDFFGTVGVRLLAGRPPAPNESQTHVVLSESLATMLWPHESAIGKRLRWDEDSPGWSDVIGVATTIRENRDSPQPQLQVYLPRQRASGAAPPPSAGTSPMSGYMDLAVRVADPAAAVPLIRQALRETNPSVIVQALERVDDEVAHDLDGPRFLLALMLTFAGAGLVLSAAGIYGVLSCLVSQQLREIGVRLMLGAEPRAIARRVLYGGLATVAIGIGIGVCATAAVARGLGSLFFSVQPHDAWSYGIVTIMLLLAGGASAWRPAQRARRADPLALLRTE